MIKSIKWFCRCNNEIEQNVPLNVKAIRVPNMVCAECQIPMQWKLITGELEEEKKDGEERKD